MALIDRGKDVLREMAMEKKVQDFMAAYLSDENNRKKSMVVDILNHVSLKTKFKADIIKMSKAELINYLTG